MHRTGCVYSYWIEEGRGPCNERERVWARAVNEAYLGGEAGVLRRFLKIPVLVL